MQQRQNRRHGLALKDFWNIKGMAFEFRENYISSAHGAGNATPAQWAENQEQSQCAGGTATAPIVPLTHLLTQNSTQNAFVSFSRVSHQKGAGLKTPHHSFDTTLADNRGNHSDGTRDCSVKLPNAFPLWTALLQDFATPTFPHCWPWSRTETEFLIRTNKKPKSQVLQAQAQPGCDPSSRNCLTSTAVNEVNQ